MTSPTNSESMLFSRAQSRTTIAESYSCSMYCPSSTNPLLWRVSMAFDLFCCWHHLFHFVDFAGFARLICDEFAARGASRCCVIWFPRRQLISRRLGASRSQRIGWSCCRGFGRASVDQSGWPCSLWGVRENLEGLGHFGSRISIGCRHQEVSRSFLLRCLLDLPSLVLHHHNNQQISYYRPWIHIRRISKVTHNYFGSSCCSWRSIAIFRWIISIYNFVMVLFQIS